MEAPAVAEPAEPTVDERLKGLTSDQVQGLAHILYVAQWITTLSYSKRLSNLELEAMLLRGYGVGLGAAACRLAKLPTAGAEALGRELVLATVELEPAGKLWCARATLDGHPAHTPRVQVEALDQPAREVALSIALVQLARLVLVGGAGDALVRYAEALDTACGDLEEALYPEPTLEQKIETARQRHERAMASEAHSDEEPGESEPSFHGTGGVD